MKRNRNKYSRLTGHLALAVGHVCEICGKRADWRGLQGAHIIPRSRGTKSSPDEAWNILIVCAICHDHVKYPKNGLPIETDEALRIAEERNRKHGIDPCWNG